MVASRRPRAPSAAGAAPVRQAPRARPVPREEFGPSVGPSQAAGLESAHWPDDNSFPF
jgi:hypothetical protein